MKVNMAPYYFLLERGLDPVAAFQRTYKKIMRDIEFRTWYRGQPLGDAGEVGCRECVGSVWKAFTDLWSVCGCGGGGGGGSLSPQVLLHNHLWSSAISTSGWRTHANTCMNACTCMNTCKHMHECLHMHEHTCTPHHAPNSHHAPTVSLPPPPMDLSLHLMHAQLIKSFVSILILVPPPIPPSTLTLYFPPPPPPHTHTRR
jgi:hypothetical protein